MDGPVNRIMVYVDGSEQAITAAQYAVCLARSTGAELYALYVVNTRALSDLVNAKIFLQAEQEEYQEDLESDADRYLQHAKQLGRDKGVAVKTLNAAGTVNVEIKNMVKDNEIDLLVIGEISRIRSRRDELYNETERAMRSVPCSVLVVKDEDYVWDVYNKLT